MIASKIIKTLQQPKTIQQRDSPKMKKTQSNYVLPSKSQSQKLKTTGYRNDSTKLLNNSMYYLQDNITNFHSSLCMAPQIEESQYKNELYIKQQLIIEQNKKISQLEILYSNQQQINQQLQNDILILNQTIEKICEQLTKEKEQSENLAVQFNELQNVLALKQQEITKQKNENLQLITFIKLGTHVNGKENNLNVNQHNYQEQINLLKEQIQVQKQSFQQTESSLQMQIQGLNSFFNSFVLQSKNNKDQIKINLKSQSDKNTFQQQFHNLEDDLLKFDSKFKQSQQKLNILTEQQSNENGNIQNIKEIAKFKQIIQIQKKQIELQQQTILNQHFEIQNLQTLLYKSEYESISEYKKFSAKKNDQLIINQELVSSLNEEIYHLNDSQSDIKPKQFLDSLQNTLQKFEIITEESTFRY